MDLDNLISAQRDLMDGLDQDLSPHITFYPTIQYPINDISKLLSLPSSSASTLNDLEELKLVLSNIKVGIDFYQLDMHETTGPQYRHLRASYRDLADQVFDAIEDTTEHLDHFEEDAESGVLRDSGRVESFFDHLYDTRSLDIQHEANTLASNLTRDCLTPDIRLLLFVKLMDDVAKALQHLATHMREKIQAYREGQPSQTDLEVDAEFVDLPPMQLMQSLDLYNRKHDPDLYNEPTQYNCAGPLPELFDSLLVDPPTEEGTTPFDPGYDFESC